jgi:hypothetical protein
MESVSSGGQKTYTSGNVWVSPAQLAHTVSHLPASCHYTGSVSDSWKNLRLGQFWRRRRGVLRGKSSRSSRRKKHHPPSPQISACSELI